MRCSKCDSTDKLRKDNVLIHKEIQISKRWWCLCPFFETGARMAILVVAASAIVQRALQ